MNGGAGCYKGDNHGQESYWKGLVPSIGFGHVTFEMPIKLPVDIWSRKLDFESGGQVRSGLGI